MNRRTLMLPMLFALIFCTFTSCGSSDEDVFGDSNFNAENSKIAGSKWTTTNWDYGIGDDWASTLDETYSFYFYSSTEGLFYYGRKDNDSDFGSSSDRVVAHFTYNVSGSEIELEYITEPVFSGFSKLTFNGNTLSVKGFTFTKGTISSEDNTWLATLHGSTGSCSWYHNLKNAIWIVGEGKMDDYQSYAKTPWAIHDRTPNYVYVESGVTRVGNHAFANPSIGEVELPLTLTEIGSYAFSGASISSIYMSDGITEISDGAFCQCSYLTNIYMPASVEVIGDYAFIDCKKASLYDTKKLKRIGKWAFMGCTVTRWTDSDVLEEIGEAAFTDCDFSEVSLPNSLITIGNLAFSDTGISTIRIGTGLTNVTGTPFYPKSNGTMYVDKNQPLALTKDIIDPDKVATWRLYVPEGSVTAYSQADYWKKFRNIYESSDLTGDGTTVEEEGDGDEEDAEQSGGEEDQVVLIVPKTYSNNGMTYEWIKVESPTMPTFYIMQTELVSNSHFRLDDDIEIGTLDINGDGGIIKAELRSFLDEIKAKTGIQMRPPTEDEWKYAASGGSKGRGCTYSGSNIIDNVAWYKGNSGNSAHNPALKQPNELGLYDMSGNYGELTNNNLNDPPNTDGRIYGGSFEDAYTNCTVTSSKAGSTSGRIPGTNLVEKNAFDGKVIAVRLVFTAP